MINWFNTTAPESTMPKPPVQASYTLGPTEDGRLCLQIGESGNKLVMTYQGCFDLIEALEVYLKQLPRNWDPVNNWDEQENTDES